MKRTQTFTTGIRQQNLIKPPSSGKKCEIKKKLICQIVFYHNHLLYCCSTAYAQHAVHPAAIATLAIHHLSRLLSDIDNEVILTGHPLLSCYSQPPLGQNSLLTVNELLLSFFSICSIYSPLLSRCLMKDDVLNTRTLTSLGRTQNL